MAKKFSGLLFIAFFSVVAGFKPVYTPLFAAVEFHEMLSGEGDTLTIHNPYAEDMQPTITIRGCTDYTSEPVKFTENPALNGNQLAKRLLTGSVLTLNPNGTGVWMYDGGFNGFDPAVPLEETENPAEYVKHRWDTLDGKARSFKHPANVFFLRLAEGSKITYPIEFPEGITIQSVRLVTGYRTLDADQQIEITLSRDKEGADVIGAYTVSSGEITPVPAGRGKSVSVRHPVSLFEDGETASVTGFDLRFEDADCSNAYLSFVLKAGGKNWTLTGPLHITAWLDTSGIQLPVLQPGDNTITYSDAAGSSHKAEIIAKLPPVPEKELVLSSFEEGLDNWGASDNASAKWSEGAPSGAYRGSGYLSVTLDPQDDGKGNVRHPSVGVGQISETDWSEYSHLQIALHTDGKSPGNTFQRIRIGMYSRPEGYSHLLWISPSDTWQKYSIDISKMGRSNVRWLRISTYGQRWTTEKAFTLFVDDIRLVRYPEEQDSLNAERNAEARQAEDPDQEDTVGNLSATQTRQLRENMLKWLSYKPPPLADAGQKAPAEKFFPMGVWFGPGSAMSTAESLGIDRWDGFKAVLHDLRAHNMNSIMGSSHPFDQDGGKYFDLLEDAGMRSWTYGPRYFHDQGSPEKNEQWFRSNIEPGARQLAPFAKGRWGLLAWGLTEEIQTGMVQSLDQYYRLMQEIAPDNSIVILHNHLEPQKRQAELFPGTRVMAYDRYPFRQYWADPLKTWASGIDDHYRVARSINANLWMVLQSYSHSVSTPGGNTYYARHISHPLQMKAQAWVAVGRGATGLYAYPYRIRSSLAKGESTSFKTITGDDTPAYKAWAEALAEIKPYAELLLKLQKQETSAAESGDDRIWITTFKARPGENVPGTFLMAVNADWEKARTFKLTCSLPGSVYDVATGKQISPQELESVTVSAGSGRFFRVE